MATITNFPGTMQGWTGLVPGQGTWINPDNAKASDTVYTTVGVGGDLTVQAQTSGYLYFRNFGFSSSIGSGATINGITVELKLKSTASSTCTISRAVLASNTNTLIGTAKGSGTAIPTSDTVFTLGSSTDTWSATLTQAVVTGSNFGFVLEVKCSDGVSVQTISCDYGKMTIDYTGGVVALANIAGCMSQGLLPANFAF